MTKLKKTALIGAEGSDDLTLITYIKNLVTTQQIILKKSQKKLDRFICEKVDIA
jgi:hypothetical protein